MLFRATALGNPIIELESNMADFIPTSVARVDEKNQLLVKKLSDRRRELNMSVYELSAAIGMDEEEYIAYENGQEEMPASVLFVASVMLNGDPLTYLQELEEEGSVQSSKGFQAI